MSQDDDLRTAIERIEHEVRTLRDGNGHAGVRQIAATLYGDARTGTEGLVEKMETMHASIKELVQARRDDVATRRQELEIQGVERRADRRQRVFVFLALAAGFLGQLTDLPKWLFTVLH